MEPSPAANRAERVTRAAVEVLGQNGAAGLTHRAVDRHAGLAEGSTSNLFRTRDALIAAVCGFLTKHDLATMAETETAFGGNSLDLGEAAQGLATIVMRWTGEEALLTAARLELFLMARRDSQLAAQLADVRQTFHDRTSDWLERLAPGAGRHARYAMAVIEGLTANQLLHERYRMTGDELKAGLEQMLSEACLGR